MVVIRPCADLRNCYNEISKICHETKEAMYITKNGTTDLVILYTRKVTQIVLNIICRILSKLAMKSCKTFRQIY